MVVPAIAEISQRKCGTSPNLTERRDGRERPRRNGADAPRAKSFCGYPRGWRFCRLRADRVARGATIRKSGVIRFFYFFMRLTWAYCAAVAENTRQTPSHRCVSEQNMADPPG